MFLLFQDTGDLIDKGLEITPYAPAAFGALIVALCTAVVFLWRKLGASEKDYKNLAEEVVTVLATISLRLEDSKNNTDLLKEIKNSLDLIKTKLLE